MIRNPKEAFIASDHRAKHEAVVKTESFKTACEYALLEFINLQRQTTDQFINATQSAQLAGAKKVLHILSTIHEVKKENEPKRLQGLNYNT